MHSCRSRLVAGVKSCWKEINARTIIWDNTVCGLQMDKDSTVHDIIAYLTSQKFSITIIWTYCSSQSLEFSIVMQSQHNLYRNNSIVFYSIVCVLLESFIKFIMCMYMLVLIRELQMAVCIVIVVFTFYPPLFIMLCYHRNASRNWTILCRCSHCWLNQFNEYWSIICC